MIIKKKEVIAAALVVLIGCAGYLNWSYQDTMTVRDGESYIETGRRLGEAQLVNSEAEVEENETETEAEAEETGAEVAAERDDKGTYFETALYERENTRSKAIEILNQTCSNNSFDEETRRKAGDKIIAETDNINSEHEIESIAQSKGYEEVCAYVKDGGATVAVRKEGFSKEDAMVISEITQNQTGLDMNNIKIIEVK